MEIIEFVVILAILVGLIAIISSVELTVREKATNVKTQITNGLNSITYK
ncbi:MAG: hypothetical protein Q4C50_02265 [Eubacteriales bacterium]|nr:hypothetical protein [Eubacteriales bacterium]